MKNESEKKVVTMSKDYKELTKDIFKKYGIVIIFLGMVALLSVLSPAFLQTRNLLNVVRQISVIGLVAMGVTMVIITTGIDLSSGSVIALSAVVAASLAQRPDWAAAKFPGLTGLPVIVPIMAGLAVGTIAGCINGTVIAKTKIPPFIATLGMMTVARGVALLYADGRPISSLTESYNFIGQGEVLGIPFPIILLAIMALAMHTLLNNTKFGRYVYAIGGNEQAAVVSGLNVSKYKILIYTIAGFLSGMAGIVLSARISSGQPGLGLGYELDAIASAVIGGTSLSGGIGTIPGTIVGALIIGVLNNGLDLLNVSAYWQQIVKGLIIVGAVILDERKNRS
ncbi:monosaccharide ABC transporter membrane protein, CUT2 family [Anaerovirgula multivorans]|uniref:Monosaccharide ABC transporter membrane protein, CUT2 family n=1 Tax=Anaerovirgula multivorans TaxID=312168 RepID=A0A239AS32_9FIRM|nr:ABC transporter permease [Anaerovirgula multivorans]SNR98102.1 monosaccharide ABC transporter membrane protein, CUT2 family [Anaerovirgula multivorans]